MLFAGCVPCGGVQGLWKMASEVGRRRTFNLNTSDDVEFPVVSGSGDGQSYCLVGVVEAVNFKSIRCRDGRRTFLLEMVIGDSFSRADPTAASMQTQFRPNKNNASSGSYPRLIYNIIGSAARDR